MFLLLAPDPNMYPTMMYSDPCESIVLVFAITTTARHLQCMTSLMIMWKRLSPTKLISVSHNKLQLVFNVITFMGLLIVD